MGKVKTIVIRTKKINKYGIDSDIKQESNKSDKKLNLKMKKACVMFSFFVEKDNIFLYNCF